jgi:hypothetical protein
MAKTEKTQEVTEAKIRNAIWYLKVGKTKKFVCEFLGIPYSTKKLDKLIEDFRSKEQREKELKKAARTKIFTQAEKQSMAAAYMSGDSQSAIATQYYISPQKLKNILIEMSVPIRGRGKNTEAKVDHINQDLSVKFKKADKVFVAKFNCFATIAEVYDEDYLDYLESGRQRYQETHPFKQGFAGKYEEPTEGVHYEIYWQLEDGKEMKLSAMKTLRNRIIKSLEETGREYYLVWREDDQGAFYHLSRDSLYPFRNM